MLRLLLAIAVTVLSAAPAHPWGSEGHSIVAEIAQRRLTSEARDEIRALIGEASLASIATWADDIRALKPETARWHFVDIPLASSDYQAGRDCKVTPTGDCIVAVIDRLQAVLADRARSKQERRDALKFLVHLIADVQQPLHTVGDLKGGNDIRVTFFTDPAGKARAETSLHLLWDFGLIRHRTYGWGAYVEYLETTWLPANAAALQGIDAGTVEDWAEEAHAHARSPGVFVPTGSDLDAAYAELAKPILDRQLAVAGLRLAAVLNATLR